MKPKALTILKWAFLIVAVVNVTRVIYESEQHNKKLKEQTKCKYRGKVLSAQVSTNNGNYVLYLRTKDKIYPIYTTDFSVPKELYLKSYKIWTHKYEFCNEARTGE